MIMAQSLYKRLRRRDPSAELHVLAPAWSLSILERMPEISRTIEQPAGHGELRLMTCRVLGRSLRAESYTQAIVLPRSLKAALIPFFASIPRRTGFRGEWRYGLLNDIRPLDKQVLDQTVKRFVALGAENDESLLPEIDVPSLETSAEGCAATLERFGFDPDENIVALMPGAEYGPAKRWPIERFADLAQRLNRVGVAVRVLGSAKERLLGDEILERAEHSKAANLCGETSLVEAVDLLSVAGAAVTNDSGLMHMAAAVGTQVIALYGSSTPHFTPPLTESKHVFYLGLECSPCFKRDCPLDHFRCMREISVDEVCSAVVTALGNPVTIESRA